MQRPTATRSTVLFAIFCLSLATAGCEGVLTNGDSGDNNDAGPNTPRPDAASVSGYWNGIAYDPVRSRLVLIGSGVYTYDLNTNLWQDVTPAQWTPNSYVNGVYHPGLDAIFFRGLPGDYSCCGGNLDSFQWHRMVFSD